MDGGEYLYPAMEPPVDYLQDMVVSTVYLWRVDVEMLHEAKIVIDTDCKPIRVQ